MRGSRFILGTTIGLTVWIVMACSGIVPAQGVGKRSARQPKELNETVITADSLTFDYGKSKAVFKKNVVVIDSNMKMKSDLLTVSFEGTNQIKSAIAVGNVRLYQEENWGTCKTAEYWAADGKIVLTGNAELHQKTSTIMADEIKFFIRNDEIHSVTADGNVRMKHRGEGSPFRGKTTRRKMTRGGKTLP